MAVADVAGNATSRSRLLAGATIAALLAVASRYAYGRIFGQFAAYDDEGYILQTVRSYLAGAPLYDEVYSQYGPAFYGLEWIVHGLLRAPLDHDTVRLFTIGYWLGAAALSGIVVFRVTRSVLVCGVSVVLVFVHLAPLINEPGHPQGLLLIAVLLACALAADTGRSMTARGAACCGALVAFAALVKVNVGAYLFLGLALPLVMASPLPRAAGWLALGLTASVPFVILRAHLGSFGLSYAIVVSASVVSIGLVASGRLRSAIAGHRVILAFCVTGLATGVLLLLPSLLGGTTPGALLRAIVLEPARFASVFFMPAILPGRAPAIAVVSLLASAAFLSRRIARSSIARVLVTVARLGGILLVLPTSQGGHAAQIGYLTPALWLLVLGPDRPLPPPALFARSAIACVAALQTLQAYPVAGSQVALATVLIVVAAAIALDDAVRTIASRVSVRFVEVALQGAAVATAMFLAWPALPGDSWSYAYRTGYGLRLPGAERLRLTRSEVARYQWLSATAGATCKALLTVPGLSSFNAWSGIPPVTHTNATAWLTLLSEDRRERIWTAAATAPDTCIIANRTLASNWLGGRDLSTVGADRHLSRLQVVAAADGYELMASPGGQSADAGVSLMSGRQSFARGRTPLPIAGAFLNAPRESTIRLWLRTRAGGVVLGCQSNDRLVGIPPEFLPLVYVGRRGTVVAQHISRTAIPEPAGAAINDGAWHHIALVRQPTEQRLYVDGVLARTILGEVPDQPLDRCQAGTGFTKGWPDGSDGWMPFTGDVTALRVTARAWDAGRVADDWQNTRPAEHE